VDTPQFNVTEDPVPTASAYVAGTKLLGAYGNVATPLPGTPPVFAAPPDALPPALGAPPEPASPPELVPPVFDPPELAPPEPPVAAELDTPVAGPPPVLDSPPPPELDAAPAPAPPVFDPPELPGSPPVPASTEPPPLAVLGSIWSFEMVPPVAHAAGRPNRRKATRPWDRRLIKQERVVSDPYPSTPIRYLEVR
jgi:hypothetical protein